MNTLHEQKGTKYNNMALIIGEKIRKINKKIQKPIQNINPLITNFFIDNYSKVLIFSRRASSFMQDRASAFIFISD